MSGGRWAAGLNGFVAIACAAAVAFAQEEPPPEVTPGEEPSTLEESPSLEESPNPEPEENGEEPPPDEGEMLPPSRPTDAPSIASVTLQCELPRCADEDEFARLLSLTDLAAGKTYYPELGDAARYFLLETKLFQRVRINETLLPNNQVDIVIETEGQTYIHDVDVSVRGSSLVSEIEQRIFLRPGQPWRNDEEEIEEQKESIRGIFRRDGYLNVEVEITAIDVEPYLVDLQVVVNKGPRNDVRDIYVHGHHAFTYDEIRSTLLSEFGFFRTFTTSAFEAGLDELMVMYREAGYIRARIPVHESIANEADGVVDLYLDIREGPQFTFNFSGNEELTDSELRDVLPFLQTGFIDSAEVQGSAQEIEALYRAQGFFSARVTVNEEWLSDDEALIEYSVYEGPLAELREITFEGNYNIPSTDLLELLSTFDFGTQESGGRLQPDQLEADIRAIEAYYRELGYLSAYVPRWTVVTEEEDQTLYVTIFIEEGPRTMVSDVRFVGTQLVSQEDLSEQLQMHEGEPFGPAALDGDRNIVLEQYLDRGYDPPKYEATCIVDGVAQTCRAPTFPGDCQLSPAEACQAEVRGDRTLIECPRVADQPTCRLANGLVGSEVAIEYRVAEGNLMTVGEIFVVGNFATSESVIRRELALREGQPYNPVGVIESQSNLRSLGIFNSVTVSTIGVGARSNFLRTQVGIVVRVEEKPNQVLTASAGLAGQNPSTGELRGVLGADAFLIDSNFLGRAEELRVGGSGQVRFFGANAFDFDNSDFTLAAIYYDPRFYWFFDLSEEPWEAQTSVTYTRDLLSAQLHIIELTGAFEVRQELAPGLFLGGQLLLSRVRTKPATREEFDDILDRTRTILQFSPSLTYDTRDNPLNPREGFRGEITIDLADDPTLPFREIIAEDELERYTRVRLSASQHLPLTRLFVLALYAEMGFALGGPFTLFELPEDENLPIEQRMILPPSVRFNLGGVAGLRGFADQSLGPHDGEGNALFGDVLAMGTSELRFPLIPSADFYGALFLETGQLTADFIDLEWEGFRYSGGLGIRWLAGGLIPVVLDYGLVLDRRPGEGLGQLQFNVGYTF